MGSSDQRGRGPHGEGSWVDLYEYKNCDNVTTTCEAFEVPNGTRINMKKILPTQRCTIETVKTRCPKKPAHILKAYYGDWRTSKMQYCDGEWKSSCPAVATTT